MMDMETVVPRTCSMCKGTGYMYWGDEENFEVRPCDECDDGSGINEILAADAQDELDLERETNERIIN
jgi:hypothetical protein